MPNDNSSALAIITKNDNGDLKTSINISLSPDISEREEQLITKLLPVALDALKNQEGEVTIARHEERKSKHNDQYIDVIFAKHRTTPAPYPLNFPYRDEQFPPCWVERRVLNDE